VSLPAVFRPQFRNDLAAGYDWYEAQQAGLGEDFLSAVLASVRSIEPYAHLFAAVHGDVRRAMVPRFPFALFYLIEPRRIVVLRMLHTARNPNLWPRRKA
jgi:hypothetical protein